MLKKVYEALIRIVAVIIIVVAFIVGTKISLWFFKLAYSKFIEAFSMI
ncbi:hypothetical protein [uncultured Fusobacterium sp.]|nr:hypothetical protein [uncultured Fusobacterium sp.]